VHVLDELAERGFLQQTTGIDALRSALNAGPVTFYVGIDPTADSMHVGHTVPLMAAHLLQRAGHRPIVVMGGGTAMVGDPSGKTEMRQLIDQDRIQTNIAGIRRQVEHLLVIDGERGLIVDNADWLLGLNYISFLRDIGRHFSVNRMLSAEAYRLRLEKGLSFIEFNYMLLQSYDFLFLHQRYGCTLQVGGDDQWGNILAGTELIRRVEGHDSHALTFPLVTTASGAKMGKTADGAIWLDPERTSAFDFYQYWINLDDRDVGPMLRRFTLLPLDEIPALEALEGAAINEAKRRLAWEVTARIHGPTSADSAREAARAMVSGAATDDLPTVTVAWAPDLQLAAVLCDAGLAASRSEARRLIQGGGVKVNQEKVDDERAMFDLVWFGEAGAILRVGKKKAARVVRAVSPA
jgi:tyrosyl-tRNA synthetase